MADEMKAVARPAREVQIELNAQHYEAVYRESLKAARRIVGEQASDGTLYDVATTLFERNCHDAVEMAKEREKNEKLGRLVQPFLAALERRGLYV